MSQKTVAAYGTWSSPISAEMVAEAGVRLSAPWIEDGVVWWLEGRAAEMGRVVLVRHDRDGQSGRRRSGRLQRPHVRARVRRRRLLHPSRRRVLLEVRRPAPLPCRSRRGSRSHHARGGWSAPPLRGRAHHVGRPLLDRRSGEARRERSLRGRRQRARRAAHGRIRGTTRHRGRARLLLEPSHLTRRRASVLPRLEPALDAVGRLRAARRRPRSERRSLRHRACRRRGRLRVDLATRVEPDGRPRVRERSKRLVEPRAHPW